MELEEWDKLSPEEKRVQLYLKQKKMLEDFLEHGAISQAQFDKSTAFVALLREGPAVVIHDPILNG